MKRSQQPLDVRDALRSSIEHKGDDAARYLVAAFDRFNATYFAGRLSKPAVLITPPGSARAWADHVSQDEHGIPSRIRIAPRVVAKGELFALDVLLHEMAHQYVDEVEGVDERSYRGHGPRFAAICNAIGKLLGLAEVAARPRGKSAAAGILDCAQWPLNVRPEGYYGPGVEVRAKAPKSVDEGDDECAADEGDGDEGDEGDELQQLRREVRELRAICREQELQIADLQREADQRDALRLEVRELRALCCEQEMQIAGLQREADRRHSDDVAAREKAGQIVQQRDALRLQLDQLTKQHADVVAARDREAKRIARDELHFRRFLREALERAKATDVLHGDDAKAKLQYAARRVTIMEDYARLLDAQRAVAVRMLKERGCSGLDLERIRNTTGKPTKSKVATKPAKRARGRK
jgi:hypothetical protein